MIKTYSLKADGEKWIAPNFQVKEFACKDGSDFIQIDTDLVIILQAIRSHFGKPLHINSAYRTANHNTKVGGVYDSRHLSGQAADIFVYDIDAQKVYDFVNSIMLSGGLIIYDWGCHVDTREIKLRAEQRTY